MKKTVVRIFAVAGVAAAFADVQTWNSASHEDTKWNTTSANWDAGAVWVNGNAAVFPSDGAPTVVSEPIQLSCLTNRSPVADITLSAENSGKLVFVGDAPRMVTSEHGIVLKCPVESANQLELSGGGVFLLSGANVVPQGYHVVGQNTSIRVGSGAALGTGSVVLEKDTLLWTTVSGLDITNRIVQNGRAYGGALTGSTPVFRRLGITEANTAHVFGFGRTDGRVSSAILSLADDSDAIGHFAIRGNFALTVNGGTLKARSDSRWYFRDWDNENYWNNVITVGPDGFVFDSNGASDISLGAQLSFPNTKAAVTNNIGVCSTAYANPFVDSDLSGWTLGTLPGNQYGDSARRANGSAFCNDESYYTTNGSYFIALRCYSYAESTINVPSDGLWRMACDLGHRPGYSGYTVPVTVTVDPGTESEQSYVIPSRGSAHPFMYCETCAFPLAAGEHTVRYATGNIASGNAMSTVHFDTFRIVEADVETYDIAPLVKKGEGTLAIDGLDTDGRIAVSNGTLRLISPALVDAKVDVANGATLELGAGSLTGVRVAVASGATLRISGYAVNRIVNGGFEEPVISDYVPHMSTTGWSQTTDGSGNSSGFQRTGRTMSSEGAYTSEGDQTAYVRANGGVISKTFTLDAAGTYRLSFIQGQRLNYKGNLTTTVKLDGDDVYTTSLTEAESGEEFQLHETEVTLAAGDHTLEFKVTGSNTLGAMMFIDDVRLVDVASLPTRVVGGRIDLARGATVDLQNLNLLEIPAGVLFVDGAPIRGSRSALASAGITVVGEGKIQIGPPTGLTVIFK